MSLQLDDKQRAVVDDLLEGRHQGGAIIAGQMAAGKTNVAVALIKEMNPSVVLIACPIKGTRVSWVRTLRRAGVELPIYNLKREESENFAKLKAGEPGVYLIGREYMSGAARKIRTRLPLVDWTKIRTIDMAFFDECHSGSNRKSATFKAWRSIKAKKLKVAMSGTPWGNRFEGAWAVTIALWPHLIDTSFWRWANRRCTVEERYVGRDEPVKQVGSEIQPGLFASQLPAYYLWEPVLSSDDPAGWEPLQVELVVELTGKHRAMYEQMEEEALVWLEEHPLSADIPLVQRIRLRQISLAVPSFVDGEITFVDSAQSAKAEAFEEWLEDHPDENILIGTDSKHFAYYLSRRLSKKAEVSLWTGDTPAKAREEILASWGLKEGQREILIATIPALAEGVDGLQHVCSTLVWMNKHYSGILNDQFRARLKRRGQTKRITEVFMIAADTTDEEDNNRLDQVVAQRLASQGKENVHVA